MKNDDPIIYKILQADSGALQYLGFAKNQARHLAENGDEPCKRTWDMGDATVEVQYLPSMGFKIAKIKLIGGGLIPYYYADMLYSPCKGRTLSIVVSAPPQPVMTATYIITYPIASIRITDISIFIDGVFAGVGSRREENVGGLGIIFTDTFVDHPVGDAGFVYNGTYISGGAYPVPNIYPPYAAAAAAVTAATGGLRTRVLLSDGTELASQPIIITANNLTSYLAVRTWSGGDSVQLFNVATDLYTFSSNAALQYLDSTFYPTGGPLYNTTLYTSGTVLKFVVPPDVMYPLPPDDPPAYPGLVPYPLINTTSSQTITFPYFTIAQWGYADGTQSASGSDLYRNTYIVPGGSGSAVHTYTNFPISYGGVPCFVNGQQGVNIVNGQIDTNYIDTRVYTPDPYYQSQLGAFAQRVNKWNTDWAAARAVAVLRERARLKLCSDNLKAQLGALPLPGAAPLPPPLLGAPPPPPPLLPEVVLAKLRAKHLVSANTKMKQVMKTDTPADTITYPSDAQSIRTRSVTLSYKKKDKDGNDINPSQTITGTRTVTQVIHIDSQGSDNDQVRSLKIEYINYPLIEVQSGSIKDGLGIFFGDSTPNDFRLDGNVSFTPNTIGVQSVLSLGDPIALIANGIVSFGWQPNTFFVAGASRKATGAIDGVNHLYYGPYTPDPYNQGNSGVDRYGSSFVPPFPRTGQTILYSHPTIYTDYRRDINRSYDATGGNPDWLDSAFIDGELIDIFPVSTVHTTLGDLGLFPTSFTFIKDTSETSLLTSKIDMKATYKYTYLTGAWTFVSVTMFDGKTNPDKTVNKPPVMLPYQPKNLIFRSRVKVKDEWPDVTTKYRAQAADIAANPTVNSDLTTVNNPVFVALQKL